MKLTDEFYAIVNPEGERIAGFSNRWKLFETEVGAVRFLESMKSRQKDFRERWGYPNTKWVGLSIVKLTFKVVTNEEIQ
jgi:hypothetical protein